MTVTVRTGAAIALGRQVREMGRAALTQRATDATGAALASQTESLDQFAAWGAKQIALACGDRGS